ncbi:MAG TPA: ATP-binding protein [Myxococcota bacterium]|nr:ATP-binding protein [Myxococcota bacterium]HRY92377.1 ATP-binding protein [Myxococcota bacterium]
MGLNARPARAPAPAPAADSIEQARLARVLRGALKPLVALALLGSLMIWIPGFTRVPGLGTGLGLAFLGLLLGTEWLIRRDRVRLAAFLFLVLVHALFGLAFFLFGALQGPYVAALVAQVCIAGLVGGRRAALLSFLLGGAVLASAYVLAVSGSSLPDLSPSNPLANMLVTFLLTGLVAHLLWVAFEQLELARREREAYERERRAAHRLEALGRLAGGVAHDFNNLLTVILANSDPHQPPGETPAGTLSRLEEIQAAGQRAAGLTQQLLAFARKQVLEPRPLELNRLVSGLRPMLARLLRENIELRLELAPDLPAVRSDPARLEQVVVNLAVNAQDAMPRGGRLTLETSRAVLDEAACHKHPGLRAGEHVLLSVSDTGTGMPAEILEQVFEPFFTTKASQGGSGLGLATVHGIVTQSGGAVLVYSEPGKGSTFKVYLPALAGSAPAAEPVASPPRLAAHSGLGQGRVALLADDDAAVRAVAGRMLQALGFQVLQAGDGHEALRLEAAHAGALDVLVTDVVMVQMDGLALVEALLVRRPGLKVLFISGYSEEAVQGNGLLKPGARFLSKPFSVTQLEESLRGLLGERA